MDHTYALSVLCTTQGLLFVVGGSSTWRVPRELCMRGSSSNYSLNLVQNIHLTPQRLVQLVHYLKLKSVYQQIAVQGTTQKSPNFECCVKTTCSTISVMSCTLGESVRQAALCCVNMCIFFCAFFGIVLVFFCDHSLLTYSMEQSLS